MSLTVADLIAKLATLPSGMPVVLATDAEGNGFSPLATIADALYEAGSPYSGQWYATAEQRAVANDGEWDEAPKCAVPAVFLWPAS